MLEALKYITSEPYRAWLAAHEELLTAEQICRLIMEGQADLKERLTMLSRYAAQNRNPEDSSVIAACICDMDEAKKMAYNRTLYCQYHRMGFSHMSDHWHKRAIRMWSGMSESLQDIIRDIQAEIDPEEIGIPPAKEADPEELHSEGESYDYLKDDWTRIARYDLVDDYLNKKISFLLDRDGNLLQYRWEDGRDELFQEPFWLPSFVEAGMVLSVAAPPILKKEYLVALGSGHPWCLYFRTRKRLGVRRLGSLYTVDRDDLEVLPSPYLQLTPCEEALTGRNTVLYKVAQEIRKDPTVVETILAYFRKEPYAEPEKILAIIRTKEG